MYHISKQSSSFIILLFAVLASVLAAISLLYILLEQSPQFAFKEVSLSPQVSQANQNKPQMVSTDGWQNYQDPVFPLAISIPKDWSITRHTDIPGFYTVSLDPDVKQPDLEIYISDKGFLALTGLESVDFITQNNHSGITIDYLIYAIKSGDYYYTFDGSLNPLYKNEFYTIVNSVEFK